ncbi:helix-turn-helix transcriptional regulator [Proteiniclasticum sp. QWL-01]|uniref:helix-turn-helix transcriptional regulator n=1 Tax=Proteiniclasticum sp. QWL-01 TaxID=3036945 RepID=UPI00240FE31B|nr:helix-turn-helix transcriptional regulator [Proteiniclasticum sp. QWL-01]WFF71818.1 helix-turn-helix transcriptional regulator [Proteiniclasticum sp. QWL-01]
MFNVKLKQRREDKGLTQEEVAAFIGPDFSRQSVSKWERGEGFPEVETLLLLSVKLDISLEELFSEELAYYRKTPIFNVKDKYPGLVAFIDTIAETWKTNKK